MRRQRPIGVLLGAAALLGVTLVPLAAGGATATYTLKVALEWEGGDAPCPEGTSETIGCHPHPGGPSPFPGLGQVSQSYVYPVETNPGPDCPGGFNVLDYPAHLIVTGKGQIDLAVEGVDDCLLGPPSDTVLKPTQAFTVTGGSGLYAGASGSGGVERSGIRRLNSGHKAGTDHWKGTLVVPGLEFDLTPPTIRGAVNKIVRVPRGAERVRVKYKVTAADAVDGAVRASCKPKSGSRFKIGRTLVRCSATDNSANTQKAKFAISVRRAR